MPKSKINMYDLVVIGGGVNGCGIANDAAGRGLSVMLCEKDDLASSTSSKSSKLIHGGLRYLEHYEFRLVREALAEREVLLKNARHIIWPLRFILPHRPHLRPRWMILAGLFLYDNLAKLATLKKSKGVNLNPEGPLVSHIKKGFEYSDGWVDDSRLVVYNALSAQQNDAVIKTQTTCIKAVRGNGCWEIDLLDNASGKIESVKAKMLVNAAGPWVADLFKDVIEVKAPQNIRLVKGSHMVVPKIHDNTQAYILQNEDGRIVFVIPYEDDFSLIGTTDVEVDHDPSEAKISDEEIDYLIEVTNEHFQNKITRDDVVYTYSGVRPLLDDESSSPQAITRDYTLELDSGDNKAPLLSIFGGKITTYRKLAEAAANKICEFFPEAGSTWTASSPLPGADFDSTEDLAREIRDKYPWLDEQLIARYVRSYGTLTFKLLGSSTSIKDLGEHFGANLYEQEVNYLIKEEWAKSVEDILWRRTKLGLRLTKTQQKRLAAFIKKPNSKAA